MVKQEKGAHYQSTTEEKLPGKWQNGPALKK